MKNIVSSYLYLFYLAFHSVCIILLYVVPGYILQPHGWFSNNKVFLEHLYSASVFFLKINRVQ